MKQYILASYKPGGKAYLFHYEGSSPLAEGDPIHFTTQHGGVLETVVDTVHPPDYTPPPNLSVTTPVFKS